MRLSFALTLAFSIAASADPVMVCEGTVHSPFDGQTNFTDTVLVVDPPPCNGSIQLAMASGTPVSFTTRPSSTCVGCLDVVPDAPLAPNVNHVLSMPGQTRDRCGSLGPLEVHFFTGPRPELVGIDVARSSDLLDSVTIRFSEAFVSASLEANPQWIQVTREDGVALPTTLVPGADRTMAEVSVGVRGLPESLRLRVQVSKDLAFVSGASLAAAVDVVTTHGRAGDTELEACPIGTSTTGQGCQCTSVSPAAWALLPLFLRRRRAR